MEKIMVLSSRGAGFIARHEGVVTRAYRDPVGVITIGTGFTNRSSAFKAYWLKTRGHALRLGDTMPRDEVLKVLPAVADSEYGSAATRYCGTLPQNQYDGATSVVFNMGPASIKYKWGAALKEGDVRRCAHLLRNGYNTAGGKVLRGLTRRRGEEADLIQHGEYGDGLPDAVTSVDTESGPRITAAPLRQYQEWLAGLGYDPGPIDGQWGAKTKAAVLSFQEAHSNLVNDGILGPATKAAIKRMIDSRSKVGTPAAATVAAVAAAAPIEASVSTWWVLPAIIVVAALAFVGYRAWQYRDELRMRIDV